MQRILRTVTALLIMLLAAGTIFASGAGESADEDAIPLTVFRGGVTIDWESDPVILELNERLNVDIEFVTSGWGEIGQVRNLFLASGDIVDIVHHMDTSPQWIDDEVILPLTDLINSEDHPYLDMVAKAETFRPMRQNGDVYYIPMISHGSDWAFGVRQDWMDELGMDAPEDEQELFELFQAFQELGGSGTIGMQLEGADQIRRSVLPVLTAFGVPTSFYDVHKNFFIEDGQLRPVAIADETMAALSFLNRLYNAGLINRDFPQMSSFPLMHEKYFLADQAGAGWFQNPAGQQNQLRQVAPDAEVGTLPPFSADGHEFTKATGIVVNGWISVMNGSANPDKAIELLEYVNSMEGRQLLTAGIEGVHYESFDSEGYFTRNQEAWEADYGSEASYPLYFYFGQGLMHGYVPVEEYATFEEAIENVQLFDPAEYRGTKQGFKSLIPVAAEWSGAANPFQFVNFPELNDLQAAVNEVLVVGWTKAISAPEGQFQAAWDEFLAEWDRVNGDAWVQAYQDYYDENLN